MIVKVQLPLDIPGGPALIYDKDRTVEGILLQGELPSNVLAAAKGGRAYFYAQMVGQRIAFGVEAPTQGW